MMALFILKLTTDQVLAMREAVAQYVERSEDDPRRLEAAREALAAINAHHLAGTKVAEAMLGLAALRPNFRCDACLGLANRCAPCRARRAADRLARRDRLTSDGLCVECTDKPVPGRTRCQHHLDSAAERSQNYRKRRKGGTLDSV